MGTPAAPSRNLSVFDGMQSVGSGTVTIPLSGFQTPLSGPVTSTVGVVAYEGDLGTDGDGAAIQGESGTFMPLSNAVNPGPPATSASNSNGFNSTISNAGGARHLAHAGLPEQPRLRRRPVPHHGRARQRSGSTQVGLSPAATPTSREW